MVALQYNGSNQNIVNIMEFRLAAYSFQLGLVSVVA